MVDSRKDALTGCASSSRAIARIRRGPIPERVASVLMGAEADTLPGASWGRRSVKRVNSRNGYRSRRWDIPAGTVELEISKLRSGRPRRAAGRDGAGRRDRRRLPGGVCTRRVDKLVAQLGIEGISKSRVPRIARGLDEVVDASCARPLSGPYPFV